MASEEDISDHQTCNICHTPYFTKPHHEMPMKIPCGHCFGARCIQKWVSSVYLPNSCPLCRAPVLDGRTLGWWDALLEANPRQPVGWEPLVGDGVVWAQRAEDLWKHFCGHLVRTLDTVSDEEGWVCGPGVIVRQIVDCATVASFAENRHGIMKGINRGYVHLFNEPYDLLRAHLDEGDDHEGKFLTPGTSYFLWLADLHVKINDSYERLRIECGR